MNLYVDPDGYFSYRNPLNGKRKGLGHDKAKAFSEARAANAVLASMNKSDLAAWVRGIEDMTFKAWIPEYRKLWVELKAPARSTLEAADRYLTRFEATDFAHLPMKQITTVHVARYLDGLAANSGSGAATNMRARLMDVFAYAITKGHADSNPVSATLPPMYEPKRDRLSLEQFLAIRAKATPWLVSAMNLALLTGQRVSDISAMRFSDVKDGYLHVDQAKAQGSTKLKLDANIRMDAIGLSIGDAVKQCRDRIISAAMVHQTRTSGTYRAGEAVSQYGISNAFSDVRDALNIAGGNGRTPPTFHEIRSLAEREYRKQYGKEFAQALLGHKTESMSAKYDDLRGSEYKTISTK